MQSPSGHGVSTSPAQTDAQNDQHGRRLAVSPHGQGGASLGGAIFEVVQHQEEANMKKVLERESAEAAAAAAIADAAGATEGDGDEAVRGKSKAAVDAAASTAEAAGEDEEEIEDLFAPKKKELAPPKEPEGGGAG